MENEKDLITSELLSIRGGLSLISKYTDAIKNEESKIAVQKNKLDSIRSNIGRLEQEKQRLQGDLTMIEKTCDREKKYMEEQLRKSSTTDMKSTREEWKCYLGDSDYWSPIEKVSLGLMFTVIGLPIGFILLHIEERKAFNFYKRERYNEYIRSKNQYEESVRKKEEIKNEINNINAQIGSYEQDIKEQSELAQPIIESHLDTINALKTNSEAVFTALKETYGFFLSETDWCNIDLIIHYIETGRADTLKEALYQVDRQRQTDQIVRAIISAQEAICSHIESAFSRMGEALAQSFSRLDSRLQGLSVQLDASKQERLSANSRLLDKLDEQISATKMNSLLLEKANRSSDELLNDLRYNQRFWVK